MRMRMAIADGWGLRAAGECLVWWAPLDWMTDLMDRRWLPLNALRAFEAAGHAQSFTAAARQLRVAQSAVSRHVIGLEDLLGVALFERRRQSLVLTAAGQTLLAAVTQSYDRIDRAIEEIVAARGSRDRTLTLRLPPTFAQRLVVPRLGAFRAQYPGITLEIDTRPPDPALERHADVIIDYVETDQSAARGDVLWPVHLTLLCDPGLVPSEGVAIETFLAGHDLLHVRHDGRSRAYLWDLFVRRLGLDGIVVDRGLVFDTAAMAVDYALSGRGLALADPRLFEAEIASGRLARPFALSVEDGFQYRLRRTQPDESDADLTALCQWLIETFAEPPGTTETIDPLERALAIQRRSGT